MVKASAKKEYLLLLLGAVLTAVFCGFTGALFYYALKYANLLFSKYTWLVFLLPLGGMVTVLIYKLLKLGKADIHSVLDAVKTNDKVNFRLAPAVLVSTVITQLLGGSAGKEGAALQIGGGVGSIVSRSLRLSSEKYKILLLCGMSASFGAVFTLPLTALAFGLEIVFISRKFYFKAILPLLISTFGAYNIAKLLGVPKESFSIGAIPHFDVVNFLKIIVLVIACSVASILFCLTLEGTSILFSRLFKNSFVKIAVGGFVLILLTITVGENDYNGSGMHIIEHLLNGGQVVFWAFALKIIFTAITNAAGFKGGEIVPALFIGATMGSSVAALLGLPPIFGTALGMVTLFGATTKCSVAALFLGIEFFGLSGLGYFSVAIIVAQILTGKIGIFHKLSKTTCK